MNKKVDKIDAKVLRNKFIKKVDCFLSLSTSQSIDLEKVDLIFTDGAGNPIKTMY